MLTSRDDREADPIALAGVTCKMIQMAAARFAIPTPLQDSQNRVGGVVSTHHPTADRLRAGDLLFTAKLPKEYRWTGAPIKEGVDD